MTKAATWYASRHSVLFVYRATDGEGGWMKRREAIRGERRGQASQDVANVMANQLMKQGYGLDATRRFLDAQGLRLAKGRLRALFGARS